MPVSEKFLANLFAKFYVRREPSSRRTRSRRTLVRSGCNFFPRTNFLANRSPVRGGLRANSAELRRTFGERSAYSGERSAECRCWRTDGEFARSSLEFARVRGERQFAGYTAHESSNEEGINRNIFDHCLANMSENFGFYDHLLYFSY